MDTKTIKIKPIPKPIAKAIKNREQVARIPKLMEFRKSQIITLYDETIFVLISFERSKLNKYNFNFKIVKDIWNEESIYISNDTTVRLHSSFALELGNGRKSKLSRENFIHKINSLINGFEAFKKGLDNVYIELNKHKDFGSGVMIVDNNKILLSDCNNKIIFKGKHTQYSFDILKILIEFRSHITTQIELYKLESLFGIKK